MSRQAGGISVLAKQILPRTIESLQALFWATMILCLNRPEPSVGLTPNGETMSLTTQTSAPPTGARRMSLVMLAVRDQADQFDGMAPGTPNR